jgi:hypothetical protein
MQVSVHPRAVLGERRLELGEHRQRECTVGRDVLPTRDQRGGVTGVRSFESPQRQLELTAVDRGPLEAGVQR